MSAVFKDRDVNAKKPPERSKRTRGAPTQKAADEAPPKKKKKAKSQTAEQERVAKNKREPSTPGHACACCGTVR